MRLLARLLLFFLALSTSAVAQTDSYLASNGTFKTPFALANTWTAVQTFNVAPVFGVLPSIPLAQFQVLQGNGSGVAAPVTFSAAIDAAIGSTRGSILERGSTGWQIITPGTTALPYVSNGSGADPGYQALTGGGIASNTVANSNLANMAAGTVKGSIAGGAPQDLTQAQHTSLVNIFTSSLSGAAPASGGGTTNFLRADGTWVAPATASNCAPNIQVFTTAGSATYTTPTCNSNLPIDIHVMMVGAGGGAGGSGTTGGAGTAGTASTFGTSLFTANGGANGINAPATGTFPAGGTATGCQINVQGQNGSAQSSGTGGVRAFPGANSFYGGAGAGSESTTAVTGDAAKANTGSGGAAGTVSSSVAGASSGAAGGYCEGWITSSIAASYPYTVGAKGTGGSAGTSGSVGGAGGDGRITVEARFQ